MSAKKRLVRNIIIASVVLVLLIGAYIFVDRWEPTEKAEEITDVAEVKYVVEAENVQEVKITNESGEYTICKDGDSCDIPSLSTDDKNKAAISSAFRTFTKLSAIREISSDKYDDFGFDKSKVKVRLKGEEEINIVFGDSVPNGKEYYCLNEKDNKVYTVSESVYSLATQTPEYFRMKSVLAIDDIAEIDNFEVYENGSLKLKLRPATEEENAAKVFMAAWTMEKPWHAELADDKTSELLMSLAIIHGKGFSEKEHNYKYTLNIAVGDENYSIDFAEGEDEAYARRDGTTYVIDKEIYEAIKGIDPVKYISKFVNLIDVKKLSKLTVSCGGKEYTMEMGNEEGGYKINGNEVDKKEFTAKYQDIIAPSFIEYIEDIPEGEPYMTIDFYTTDGQTLNTKIYDYTEREYLAVCPNGSTVKLLKSELNRIEGLM